MKSKVFKVIISLLFLVIFNVLFFVLGGTRQSDSNWLCYGFITLSYLLMLATPLFFKAKKGEAVLEYTLWMNASVYFFVELIVGVFFIVGDCESVTWPLIIQSLLLVIFLIVQLSSAVANQATSASVAKQRAESIAIQELASKIRSRMRDIDDEALRKQVTRCYEDINSSSVESFPEAQEAELALRNAVDMLCVAIEDQDIDQIAKKAKRVSNALADRNAVIKRCRMS